MAPGADSGHQKASEDEPGWTWWWLFSADLKGKEAKQRQAEPPEGREKPSSGLAGRVALSQTAAMEELGAEKRRDSMDGTGWMRKFTAVSPISEQPPTPRLPESTYPEFRDRVNAPYK